SYPDTMTIMMTAYSSISNAVEAIKLGAHDYINKPFSHDDLIIKIKNALETTRLKRELKRYQEDQRRNYGIENIIHESKAMREIHNLVNKIASSATTTVLIKGESGTGKDLMAKLIHFSSDRFDKPFMNITCSALPETLLESELFGHEKGAFTDAKILKKGLLELADGGTVFLDEIGDMGLTLQAKMLRFLEEKAFKRVGGIKDIKVDVRVIASTNKDLETAVRQGQFREDLYYRLRVIPLHMPPLRERKEDIPALTDHFIKIFSSEFKRKTIPRFSDDAMNFMVHYDWPGNIRELRNVVERLMILGGGEVFEVEDLPRDMFFSKKEEVRPQGEKGLVLPESGTSLKEVEKELVKQALEKTRWNQTHAAKLLNIGRDALRYKMKKYGFLQ
ncbi:MAG: sigma-54 dependent transcriptional regulator, partial [Acidobacteriota bacterium]